MIKGRGYRAFLKVILLCFDLNLITSGVTYNFSHPLPGQFYCFTQRGVLWDIHNGYKQSERTTTHGREQKQTVKQDISWTLTKKIILFLSTGASPSQNLTKSFGEEQSPGY